ncbi:MAG: (Fe-S)-binding protein [Planctomycetes bacterium]|nr:(Fe-S)-binding protein [Planctomycetota bacterium]
MPRRVTLFVTCLADQVMTETAWAAAELLEQLGCEVHVPLEQTCCGQPAFNTGYRTEAREVARHWLRVFKDAETIVSPSGSCTSMVKVFFKELFPPESEEFKELARLTARTFELTQFIVRELRRPDVGARYPGKIAYHASCHLLRELGERETPRKLLEHVKGATLVPLPGSEETCCGFGGTFSVKMADLSKAMLDEKLKAVEAGGADCVIACDAGCLLHIGGGLTRRGSHAKAFHIAELLTGRVPHPNAEAGH